MKWLIVAALVVAIVIARRAYRGWQASLHTEERAHPKVPAALLGDAERTWVVFTTPYCATCEPVKQSLAASDPAARVVTVDATREPQLAQAFHVRSAPTALLADAGGEVRTRLVGAAAVTQYVSAAAV